MSLELIHRPSTADAARVPLLFVHGSYHGAWCWDEHFMPYFADRGHDCHAVSLRGHGTSPGRERLHELTLADYVADVAEAAGRIDGTPVLVGHSMGGAVAQLVAREHPDLFAGLVLLNSVPPAGLGPESLRLMFRHFRELRALRAFNRGAGEFPTRLFYSDALPEAERGAIAARLQPESDKVNYAVNKRVLSGTPSLRVPLLVLGSTADRVVSARSVQATAKAYRTEPVLLDGVGHVSMLDPQWQRVADRTLDFLDSVADPKEARK
ncbi:alpha/beta hydrolase [Kitasatospora xanthocidica]|uniref:alpha/beta hydrolase n=1 Tax=Kitasatospora xanthocidica TaxID=83382 RepID=UPI0036E04A04